MPFFCLLDTNRGADSYGKRRLVFQKEQPLKHIQIRRNRVPIQFTSSAARISFTSVLLVTVVLSFRASERRRSLIFSGLRFIPSIR